MGQIQLWHAEHTHKIKEGPDTRASVASLLYAHGHVAHDAPRAVYILYIHDYVINAIGSRKASCLCVLDLSAAFDSIDRNILITRLSSWFVIHGPVLDWSKSYVSFRSFRVKCDADLSSLYVCYCGVPQGSVLAHFLFVMHTTPLSIRLSRPFSPSTTSMQITLNSCLLYTSDAADE